MKKSGHFLLEAVISIFLVSFLILALVKGISTISNNIKILQKNERTMTELSDRAEEIIGHYYRTGIIKGDAEVSDLGNLIKVRVKKTNENNEEKEITIYLKKGGLYTD